jgi:hypothetical protein
MIFLKSAGPGFLMNKFDASNAIFIHPDKPRRGREVSRQAPYRTSRAGRWADSDRINIESLAAQRRRVRVKSVYGAAS